MSEERRTELRRRYLSLGSGELFAAAVFLGVAIVSVLPILDGEREALALWAALIPLLAVLVQGGAYWLHARRWVKRTTMPRPLARLFRVFRALDPVLLTAGLVGVIVWLPIDVGPAILVVFVWLFGVIEYVNYFVVRLAYPAQHWLQRVGQWRAPRLMQDVRAAA